MNWEILIRQFSNYMRLERSLSDNTIEAYIRDINKFREFLELNGELINPLKISTQNIQQFFHIIGGKEVANVNLKISQKPHDFPSFDNII